jgi:hypothetical protein
VVVTDSRDTSMLGQPLYVAKRFLRRCQRNRDTALYHLHAARDVLSDLELPNDDVLRKVEERITWAIDSLNKPVEDR